MLLFLDFFENSSVFQSSATEIGQHFFHRVTGLTQRERNLVTHAQELAETYHPVSRVNAHLLHPTTQTVRSMPQSNYSQTYKCGRMALVVTNLIHISPKTLVRLLLGAKSYMSPPNCDGLMVGQIQNMCLSVSA